MSEWEPEIEVDEVLARALINDQFPTLGQGGLRRLGEGWDNTLWVTAANIAFRFPRREIAIPGVEREIAILPELAARLPASIPNAAYVGVPSDRFPWPWFGSQLIAGREVSDAGLEPGQRGVFAGELGRFLRCLHSVRFPAVADLVIDPMGRGDMSQRVPRARTALEDARALWDGGAKAQEILDAADGLPNEKDVVLVHGDLNLRHALVSDTGRLAGVIDWGDMCRASRSVDLALYWSLFDADERAAFRAAYGPISDVAFATARVLALFLNAILAVYAREKNMIALEAEALRGLDQTLID